ncbi:myoferlin-like isoform X2 [Centruroides sculpturatus]|uniref:myoferlin-like isoform X2 n=1 Tax=Centruroides sculpturatus TaxID=218467 RepID=UPI000C6DC019|nr:myoferlin-like isoform X2 [Centruroides sculpturatus]
MKTGKPLPELAVQFIYMMDDLLKDLDFKLPEPIPGQHIANELDNQLRQLRNEELRNIKKRATELREKATDIEEAMSETEGYLKMLQSLCIETQNSIPDVVIWMLSGKKRVAYCRIPTHQILFSPDLERCGKYCGKLQSVMLKYPILEASSIDGGNSMKNSKSFSKYWRVPALLRIKLWFGLEVYDVFWSTSQTDAEMSVFAETYENQVNVFGKWTTSGPAMTRPAWSDASGCIALPQENFISPYGWKFDGDWFISPEPRSIVPVCTDEIYEKESRMPGGPWGPALSPWTDFSGEATVAKNEVQIPSGWIWESNWEIDLNRAVDEDGWEYTTEMEESGYQPVEMTHHLCRRRRWIRQRACLRGISDYFSEKDSDTISITSMDSQVMEEGWEYAPLFNMKFHAKERRMDLVRRRRWHRKLIAEDPSAPLVFNLAITPKKTSIVRKIMGSEASTSESKQTVEDAKLAMLSCPRLYLIYKHAHKFQLRAYVYQARDLIASDRSGFSDPYICVSVLSQSMKTAIIFQSLCPIWDQTLIFDEVIIYGDVETVKCEPPIVAVEAYDQDAIGEDEFIGRSFATPFVHLNPDKYRPPRLEWYELKRGKRPGGELLASFELLLADVGDLPFMPPKRGDFYIVPTGIRPVLQRTAIEILCWGVRNMKTFEFTHISRPSIEFECGGTIVESKFIKDAKVNPNFDEPLLYIEMLLPVEEVYMPPMHIKVRDHRQFGRKPIVGTHVIPCLHTFVIEPIFPSKDSFGKVAVTVGMEGDKDKTLVEETAIDMPDYLEDVTDKTEEETEGIDWWAKYYASIGEIQKSGKYLEKEYDTIEVYRTELEKVDKFHSFTDFLNTFPLKRGKSKDMEESDIVGEFKGTLRVYPLPSDPNAPQPMKIFQGLTQATVEEITVRVYIIKAFDLAPMDPNGLADPYICIKLGKKKRDNKSRYKPNTINPIFGEMFELSGKLPIDKDLTISVWDYDLASGDDLIGTTVIDLENRYVTKHRATCGLPKTYQISGPNKWRDSKTPKEILTEVCHLHNLPPPVFNDEKVYLDNKVYTISDFEKTPPKNSHLGSMDQRLALYILNQFNLVPEHVETRSLYNPATPELEQGKLEMWIDIFPNSLGKPGPTIDITPRSTSKFELRIVVWNTSDVLLTETNIMGEQMSDIYVKGWISGIDNIQKTDVHYRSMDGEGNFNWRFVFPFEYLMAENNIVVKKKEHFWSLDVTEHHLPPKLILQIWDNDTFSSDDFIGSLEMDLTCMPQPAKTSEKCSLEQLGYERKQTALDKLILKSHKTKVEYINIFEKRRIYGFWPFIAEDPEEGMILGGKIEMEMEIISEEEVENKPAGHGRDEPNMNPVLDPPNRPATSFLWFTSPWKSFKHIIWKKYRLFIITSLIILFSILLVLLFVYSFPEVLAYKIIHI